MTASGPPAYGSGIFSNVLRERLRDHETRLRTIRVNSEDYINDSIKTSDGKGHRFVAASTTS